MVSKAYPELVLHQVYGILVQLIQEGSCLVLGQMLETPLQYPAAIRMGRKIVNVPTEGLDKVQTFRRYALDQALDNLGRSSLSVKERRMHLLETYVIAVGILDTSKNTIVELLDE